MQERSRTPAVLFLLLLFWATPAFSSWTDPLKDLIARKAGKALAHKKDDAQAAVKQQSARFTDNGDGTLTDRKTGLIWLKNASCGTFFEGDGNGGKNIRSWQEAGVAASKLKDGFCGLKDGSKAGDWRLPDREALITLANANDTASTEKWQTGQAFTDLQSFYYWSSTKGDLYEDYAFYVSITQGLDSYAFQLNTFHVLPVRGKMKQILQ
ncbi:DUF1566 domain-containing protein [Desulfobulbus sp. F4]|nr:DUF1566 domain-containing protein [Desulfobulbus sp. F4]